MAVPNCTGLPTDRPRARWTALACALPAVFLHGWWETADGLHPFYRVVVEHARSHATWNVSQTFRIGYYLEAAKALRLVDAGTMIVAALSFYGAQGVFGYGIYGLVEEEKAVGMGMPEWVVPQHIGHLKETLAHVIIIILFVLFVRVIWFHLDAMAAR